METFFTISEQTKLFLWACVLGGAMGIIFDFFRVARILVKHRKIAVFVEDFIFTILFFLAFFIYSTERARGQLRFFVFMGAVLGLLIYILSVGTVVVTITRKTSALILKIFRGIYRITLYPVKKFIVWIGQKIKSKFVQNSTNFKNYARSVKKSLKRKRKLVYNEHTHKHKKDGKKYGKKRSKKSAQKHVSETI